MDYPFDNELAPLAYVCSQSSDKIPARSIHLEAITDVQGCTLLVDLSTSEQKIEIWI
jgi:hypothetical protein